MITFFILKSDNIENSRELKGIFLQVPSNQIKRYVGPPLTLLGGGGPVHVHICFYKTGIKAADCQILFYHTTRGLEWETVLCMIIAPSEGF